MALVSFSRIQLCSSWLRLLLLSIGDMAGLVFHV